MYASLAYINTHHAASPLPNQPILGMPSQPAHAPSPTYAPLTNPPPTEPNTPQAVTADVDADAARSFAHALRELSRDLVLKEQQIEAIVARLPGAARGEEEQRRRVRALQEERARVGREVEEAGRVRAELVARVERAIWGVGRV